MGSIIKRSISKGCQKNGVREKKDQDCFLLSYMIISINEVDG